MMSMLTASLLRLFIPLVALITLAALTVVSIRYAVFTSSIGLYITALTLVGFASIPAILIYKWIQYNKRVLARERKLEIRYHNGYKRCPVDLKDFVKGYPFLGVMDSIEMELVAHPNTSFNRGFRYQNITIEFCPSDILRESRTRDPFSVTGLQYGNKVMVTWKPDDVEFTKKLITHELGHALIWINYPVLSEKRHHEILAKCHL